MHVGVARATQSSSVIFNPAPVEETHLEYGKNLAYFGDCEKLVKSGGEACGATDKTV
jgi:hypothetical protein